MFSFIHRKPSHPTTILINGIESLTTGQLSVEDTWQQLGKTSDLGSMLAKTIVDPNDELDAAAQQYVQSRGLLSPTYQPFHTINFNPHDGISGHIWHHGTEYSPVVKGMPERVLEHCDLSDSERESIMIQLHAMSATGGIIIAIATGLLAYQLKDLRHLKHNDKLQFVGFVSLRATITTEAKRILTNTKATIYLTTGQHPTATLAVAQQLGLADSPAAIYDSRRLDVMSNSEIRATISTVRLFARATSEHKAHILDALKAQDKSTAEIKTLADLQKLLAN